MTKLAPVLPLLFVLAACGGGGSAGGATSNPAAARGADLYKAKACASCHTVDGSTLVGPTWKGLYQSEVELEDGTKVVADDVYLHESILKPSAKTVKGFPAGLMETVIKPDSLTFEEAQALVAYIKTLK
jgi:cytochrome c oxidase subunit 2